VHKKVAISLLDGRADYDIIGRIKDLEKNTILQEKIASLQENFTTFTEKFSEFETAYIKDQGNLKIMFILSQIPIWGMLVFMMQKCCIHSKSLPP
jgi:hypothetical protein